MVLQANLRKICGISAGFRQINENVDDAGLEAESTSECNITKYF